MCLTAATIATPRQESPTCGLAEAGTGWDVLHNGNSGYADAISTSTQLSRSWDMVG